MVKNPFSQKAPRNNFKSPFSTPIRGVKFKGQGSAGFDNPRENIDPHVRTKAVTAKESTFSSGKLINGGAFKFYNSDNSEFGQIYQDDTIGLVLREDNSNNISFMVNSAQRFNINASYIRSNEPIQIRAGEALELYNAGNTEYGSIYRTDTIQSVNSGTGAILNLIGDTYTTIQSQGSEVLRMFSAGSYFFNDVFTGNDKRIYFRESGGESGSIRRDSNFLYIDSGTGGTGMLRGQGTNALAFDSNLVYVYQNLSVREGKETRFYNAANTEYGFIWRDNNWLYVDSGTDSGLSLKVGSNNAIVCTATGLKFAIGGTTEAEIASNGNFYILNENELRLYNADESEYARMLRSSGDLVIDSGTGANMLLQIAGVSIGDIDVNGIHSTNNIYLKSGKKLYFDDGVSNNYQISKTAGGNLWIRTLAGDIDHDAKVKHNFKVDAVTKAHLDTDNLWLDNTVWDDQQVNLGQVRLGSSSPTWTAYKGSEVLAFSKNLDNKINFIAQLSHKYKLSSSIEFHVHVVPPDDTAGDVKWTLTYSLADCGDDFPAETTTSATQTIVANSADEHILFEVEDVLGSTSDGVSAVILCSLMREGSDVTDTYDNDIYLAALDFHIEMDTIGSKDEDAK